MHAFLTVTDKTKFYPLFDLKNVNELRIQMKWDKCIWFKAHNNWFRKGLGEFSVARFVEIS